MCGMYHELIVRYVGGNRVGGEAGELILFAVVVVVAIITGEEGRLKLEIQRRLYFIDTRRRGRLCICC